MVRYFTLERERGSIWGMIEAMKQRRRSLPFLAVLSFVLFCVRVNAQVSWEGLMSSGVRAMEDNRLQDAEKAFRDAIKLVEDSWQENPRWAASVNNLGALYEKQGFVDQAEPLYQQSLEAREKILGKDHPDVAQSLNNLASVYQRQRRYSEAEMLYKRALSIWEKTRGPRHYKVAGGLGNLATLYQAQGKYTEAERAYQTSIGIWEDSVGDHPYLLRTLDNYSTLLRATNRPAEAAAVEGRAAALRARFLRQAPTQ